MVACVTHLWLSFNFPHGAIHMSLEGPIENWGARRLRFPSAPV